MTSESVNCKQNEIKPISPQKKKGWPKGRKRRVNPKDVNAPKGPMSGYMLYAIEQRELIRQSTPTATFNDLTRMVASQWSASSAEEKQKYMEASELDKERYQKELFAYKQTDSYKSFVEQTRIDEPKVKKGRKKELPAIPVTEEELESSTAEDEDLSMFSGNGLSEIAIFTNQFLNHNKVREAELRQLRKSNTEYEEQNAILQKHIEGMRGTVKALESETAIHRTNNTSLEHHLTSLRSSLTKAFNEIPLPGMGKAPTQQNIDSYMSRLHNMITSRPHDNQSLIQTVKNIVNQLPLSS